jgi:predicted permease
MKDLLLDIRYALRVLWKLPGFTLIALVTLMLGIGANVVVFGIVNSVLLHPLDVSDPQNLYQLRLGPWANWRPLTTSYPAFQNYRQRNSTLSELAGYYRWCQARLSWGNAVKSVYGYAVTGNYFEMLGVQPQLGRFIQSADDHGPNSAPYVVLSDALWRSTFNADPNVIGTTVRLNKDPYTVIGVAPASFHGTEKFLWPMYFIPIVNHFARSYLEDRGVPRLVVLGRLKSGVTLQQAAENLSAIAKQLAREYPATDTGIPLRLIRPGLWGDTGDLIRGFLYGLTGLALLVQVAACANLASLFAARAADRRRELAVRVALGASQWRLARQVMTEAVLLSVVGGAAGLAGAGLLLSALGQWDSPYGQMPFSVDARVCLAALTFTLVSALLFGMIPARQVRHSSPLQAMKNGPVDAIPGCRFTPGDLLLGAQIAICMFLVTASVVAVRNMVRTLQAPVGFQPQGAMLANVDFNLVKGDNVSLEKKKEMIEAVRNMPGVTAAGAINQFPLYGPPDFPVFRPGTTEFRVNNAVISPYGFTISPGYLETACTRLLEGRDVSWRDTTDTPFVAIVNRTFARIMWGDAPAIGQRFILLDHLREVVGVVEDGKYYELVELPQPAVFLPLSQDSQARPTIVVRSSRSQSEMTPAIERVLHTVEPDALVTVQSWTEIIEWALFPARAATVALGAMSGLGAMLAVTGIFGMAAFNVSRRTKEIGIRMALGARARHVLCAAVGRPIVLLAVGSLLGLLTSFFVSGLLAQIVFQADPRDPVCVLGAVLTMTLLGIAASAIPAMRALAVDPSKLMREE